MFVIHNDYNTPVVFKADIDMPRLNFGKNEIINQLKNKNFNPKINSEDYKSLTLTFAGSRFELPINKINTETPMFEYFELFTPTVTKGLLRFKSTNNDNVFNESYSNSFNGFSFTNDLSIAFSQNQYESYIANNKNAYLSFQNQQNYTMAKYTQNSVNTMLDMVLNPSNMISEARQITNDAVSTGMQIAYNETQFNLSIDNMKSAPENLQNLNGSALMTHLVSEFGIYAEIYEGLETELEMANDIMFRDGYNYNRFDDFKSQLNIRHNFNYVKAIIGSLSGVPMSEESRKDFKQRVASGLRFWYMKNQPTIDYTKENYENSLLTT